MFSREEELSPQRNKVSSRGKGLFSYPSKMFPYEKELFPREGTFLSEEERLFSHWKTLSGR